VQRTKVGESKKGASERYYKQPEIRGREDLWEWDTYGSASQGDFTAGCLTHTDTSVCTPCFKKEIGVCAHSVCTNAHGFNS